MNPRKKIATARTPDGEDVKLFTMTNSNKVQVGVMEYGGTLVSVRVPDADGNFDDVVLGFDDLEGYRNKNFGGITGRFANRIANAKFSIDGVEYKITPNAGTNHIHGGRTGFSKVLWKGSPFLKNHQAGVKLEYLSKDGEEGYPGNLRCTVTYTLTNDNELKIEYEDFRRVQPTRLDDEQRALVRQLSQDIPKLWNAPTTNSGSERLASGERPPLPAR